MYKRLYENHIATDIRKEVVDKTADKQKKDYELAELNLKKAQDQLNDVIKRIDFFKKSQNEKLNTFVFYTIENNTLEISFNALDKEQEKRILNYFVNKLNGKLITKGFKELIYLPFQLKEGFEVKFEFIDLTEKAFEDVIDLIIKNKI